MCGSPVTAKELHSGVDVMHGCSTEGGDSTLGVFLLGTLVSEAATQVMRVAN